MNDPKVFRDQIGRVIAYTRGDAEFDVAMGARELEGHEYRRTYYPPASTSTRLFLQSSPLSPGLRECGVDHTEAQISTLPRTPECRPRACALLK